MNNSVFCSLRKTINKRRESERLQQDDHDPIGSAVVSVMDLINQKASVNTSLPVDKVKEFKNKEFFASLKSQKKEPETIQLGAAQPLCTCLAKPTAGDQVIALGSLFEALMRFAIPSKKRNSMLNLIVVGFSEVSIFRSVTQQQLHRARKVRNNLTHGQVGNAPPCREKTLDTRDIFALAVLDLLDFMDNESLYKAVLECGTEVTQDFKHEPASIKRNQLK